MDNYNFIDEYSLEPLTKDEVIKCFKAFNNGDLNAREILIRSHLKLIPFCIKKRFHSINMEKEELINNGIEGLVKAVYTFDISKKTNFITYAIPCIDNQILMGYRSIKKNVKAESYDRDIYINASGDSYSVLDTIKDENHFIDDIILQESYETIRSSFFILTDLEQQVIKLLYGFSGNPLQQNEIADIIGQTQGNVSRISARAREKIKRYIETEDLRKAWFYSKNKSAKDNQTKTI